MHATTVVQQFAHTNMTTHVMQTATSVATQEHPQITLMQTQTVNAMNVKQHLITHMTTHVMQIATFVATQEHLQTMYTTTIAMQIATFVAQQTLTMQITLIQIQTANAMSVVQL
jgi:hypothetical protein